VRVTDRVSKPEIVPAPPPGALQEEPPVVARLIVEIRSDGSRTIARGAIEDVVTGQRTAIEARGTSPLSLALSLAKTMTMLPRFAVRGLLGRRRR